MELLSCEGGVEQKRAYLDPVYVKDARILQNLITLEEHYQTPHCYMRFQKEITSHMRKVVTQWICDVCEEQLCEEDVFPLAANFMDRFLNCYTQLKKNRLQLLGSACLFLASKLKETMPLSAEKIVIYTDNSISLQELLEWELLVLCKLRWDLSAVIPNYFVDFYLDKLTKMPLPQVRRTTVNLLAHCTTEIESLSYPPSMVSAACTLIAIDDVLHAAHITEQCCKIICETANIEPEVLRSCHELICTLLPSRLPAESSLEQAHTKSTSCPVSDRVTPTDTLEVPV